MRQVARLVFASSGDLGMSPAYATGLPIFRRDNDTVGAHADYLDRTRLQATAAANPRGITILGPSPFAPTATR